MGLYIIVLWILIQLEAPAWCYVIFGCSLVAHIHRWAEAERLKDAVNHLEEVTY